MPPAACLSNQAVAKMFIGTGYMLKKVRPELCVLHEGISNSARTPLRSASQGCHVSATVRIVPPFVRRATIRFCRTVFARKAVKRRDGWPLHDYPVSLHMVLSHDTMLMGMLALRSFEYHTRHTWRPLIHEDGSLEDRDVSELLEHFPDARIIRRSEADKTLSGKLKSYPACSVHRMNHNLFLKVFDTRQYADHDHYIIMDSDIVFFRSPTFLLRWIEERAGTCWFMEDAKEKYASSREHLEKALGFPLWRKVNSGLDLMVRNAADLNLAEIFLERCAQTAKQYSFSNKACLLSSDRLGARADCSPRNTRLVGPISAAVVPSVGTTSAHPKTTAYL